MALRPPLTRLSLALALVVSATVFTIGVAVERSTVHHDSHTRVAAASSSSSEQGAESSGKEANTKATKHSATESSSESFLGIDTESTGLVVAAITTSVLLAVAVWFWGTTGVLLLVLAFGLGATVFDVREVIHQAQESRGTLVALATLTALFHATVVLLAGLVWRRSVVPLPAVQRNA